MVNGDSAHGSIGLYLSVPFCKAKCTFCHFASDVYPPQRMASYVDRLCNEIATAHTFAQQNNLHLPQHADTIFLGGGTPSLLEAAQFRRIFQTIRAHFHIAPHAEITVEAAPGQITDDLLEAMLQSGVNRISLGVQSFIDQEARAVGRSHTGASCTAEITRLRTAGLQDINVDLIAGLPHQTSASWQRSLEQTIAAEVDHTSIYMLEVDEDSRLGKELIGPGIRYSAHAAPTESQVADLYTQACEALNAAGLTQYEISNFARPGHHSAHNRKYWQRDSYLGIGLDAHSMLHHAATQRAVRFANSKDLDTYTASTEAPDLDPIDQLGEFEETIFLGLRLTEGISLKDLQNNYPQAWIANLLETANNLAKDGLMHIHKDRLQLTHQGRLLSSAIFGELLASQVAEV